VLQASYTRFLFWREQVSMADCQTMNIHTFISLTLVACLPATAGNPKVAEFSPEESEKLGWRIVDDGVMGGLSQGRLEIRKDGILRFFGTLSLENNGGFSSMRTGPLKVDLSGAEGLMLRVKGDGRTYQVRLGTDADYRGQEISFQAPFPTKKGEWTEVKVPFALLAGSWRGVDLPDKVFNPANIRRLGLQLADKKEGPFELHVDWIHAYGGKDPAKP
jgi:monofunctional biosynthetic peptidoglycan transglycosylase